MKIHYSLESQANRKKSDITVGNFDGIHLGHQALIAKIVAEARLADAEAVIITFVNHPAQVIRPHHCPLRITSNAQRIELFSKLGVGTLYLLEFSESFAGQTTRHFLENLTHSMVISKIVLGYDAAIGKNREGDFLHLSKLGKELHFTVEEFAPISEENAVVSSTLIRQAISLGDLEAAHKYLGRPYSVYGNVVAGQGRGKTIGFPTANLDVEGLCLPPEGVYAVTVKVGGHIHKGIANLGKAPTVSTKGEVRLEVHLFDYDGNLYDYPLEVIFGRFIRSEIKFENVEALKKQIALDIVLSTKDKGQ